MANTQGPPSIWWIRRDLRLSDNRALHEAVGRGGDVIPLFILDPALLERSRWHRAADRRRSFLFAGLRELDAALRARGSRLIVRRGQPREVLASLAAETGAGVIFAEEDYSPFARRRDAASAGRVNLQLLPGPTLHPPGLVLKSDGTPYTIFTPFSRTWKRLPAPSEGEVLPPPPSLPGPPSSLHSLPLPAAGPPAHFPAGEAEAQRRLREFADGPAAPIFGYAEGRNRLDLHGTSALSPYFRFGMLSARQAVAAAHAAAERAETSSARKGAEVWLTELVWREFYLSILYHFPEVLRMAFQPSLRHIPWRDDPADLRAWQEGRTGYPVVDAAMRQLNETGWMHNRARMIVASFLVKDLLISWQEGERWFMQQLVDGDPAANNGGWQWTAGVGTDAAPFFRIFNPVLQGQRHDPEGRYVRRYVPELARVPAKYVHAPWRMPEAAQRAAGCVVGVDYPAPIVDHAAARERTLAAYRQSGRS